MTARKVVNSLRILIDAIRTKRGQRWMWHIYERKRHREYDSFTRSVKDMIEHAGQYIRGQEKR